MCTWYYVIMYCSLRVGFGAETTSKHINHTHYNIKELVKAWVSHGFDVTISVKLIKTTDWLFLALQCVLTYSHAVLYNTSAYT